MKRILALIMSMCIVFYAGVSASAQDISIVVDGVTRTPDVAPQIIDGRTMVPVRFIAELFGCKVDWDAITQSVIIDTGKGTASGSQYKVEILNYAIDTDYEDNPCVVVHFKFYNNSTETVSFSGASMTTKAFQNGIELDSTSVKYKSLYDELDDATYTEIRPGYSLEMVEAFKIKDTNGKVEFEFVDYNLAWDWELDSDGIIARGEYNLN